MILFYDLNARIRGSRIIHNPDSIIRCTVINEDDLDIIKRLVHNALQTVVKVFGFNLVYGYDH